MFLYMFINMMAYKQSAMVVYDINYQIQNFKKTFWKLNFFFKVKL